MGMTPVTDQFKSRLKEDLENLLDEAVVLDESPPMTEYQLLLLAQRIGSDTSSMRGANLLIENDTTRLLRELLY